MVTTGDLRTDFEIRINLPIDQTLKVVETALNNIHPKNLYVNREKFTLVGKTKFSWIKNTYGVEFFVVLSYTGEYNMTAVYMILSGAGGFGMNKPMTNTLIEPFLKELHKLSNYQIMIQPRINTITYDEINRFLETSPNNILNKLQNLPPKEQSTRGALPKGFESGGTNPVKSTIPNPTLPKEFVTNSPSSEKSAEELNRLGTEAYQNNNFVYAEECFDEAIKKEPTNPKYYNNLSAVLFQLGGFVKALELVNKSIELRKDANSLNTKCGILFKMGRYDESIQAADEGLKIEPNNPDLFNSKATALAYNFQFEEALVAVDKAIQLVSNDESFSQNKQKIIQCQNWAYQHSQETGISLQDFRNNSRKRFDGNLLDSDLTNNFFRLSWENAEDLVGKLFEAKGFSSNVTPRSGDFGIDVEAKSSEIFLGIQVKHWNADVGFEDVAKTLGVASKFNKVIIVSTKSGFTRQAQEFANEDVNRYRIELWDSSRFKQELRQYVLRQ